MFGGARRKRGRPRDGDTDAGAWNDLRTQPDLRKNHRLDRGLVVLAIDSEVPVDVNLYG
jgi:hypothetical protein